MNCLEIALLLILGPVFASFLYTTAVRGAAKKSLWQRSACPYCHHHLGWFELVPLFSFIWNRRRCSRCAQRISLWYIFAELTGIIVALALVIADSGFAPAVPFLFMILTALAILYTDIRWFKIPNVLLICLLLAIAGEMMVNPMEMSNRLLGVSAAAFMFIVPALIHRLITGRAGMGMGDIKYGLVLGLELGVPDVINMMVVVFFLAGLVAITGLLAGRLHLKSRLPLGAVMSVVFIVFKIKVISIELMIGEWL